MTDITGSGIFGDDAYPRRVAAVDWGIANSRCAAVKVEPMMSDGFDLVVPQADGTTIIYKNCVITEERIGDHVIYRRDKPCGEELPLGGDRSGGQMVNLKSKWTMEFEDTPPSRPAIEPISER